MSFTPGSQLSLIVVVILYSNPLPTVRHKGVWEVHLDYVRFQNLGVKISFSLNCLHYTL